MLLLDVSAISGIEFVEHEIFNFKINTDGLLYCIRESKRLETTTFRKLHRRLTPG
jgi:hypothetical protein